MLFFLVGLAIAGVLLLSINRHSDRLGWIEIALGAVLGTIIVLWWMVFYGMI